MAEFRSCLSARLSQVPQVWEEGGLHRVGGAPGTQYALNALNALCCFAGHPLLQLRVVACFLILVCGRVINVYVPIYYRNIVNALTPSHVPGGNHTHQFDTVLGLSQDSTGVTFPLASILIYVFLKFLQVKLMVSMLN